jgi:hypothetical protein
MKVSVGWLIITILTVTCIYFFWRGCSIYETFQQDRKSGVEGFSVGLYDGNDISITSCPKDTYSYINESGFTLCCNGTVEGSKCNGVEACSLSGTFGSLPSCSLYYGSYLAKKGETRCPPSMPNYYESADGSVKGCTAGNRTPAGTAPASAADAQCKLYNKKFDDMYKIDSCTNIRMLENTECFKKGTPNTTKSLLNYWPTPVVQCSYINLSLDAVPHNCMEESSIHRYYKYLKELFPPFSPFIDRVFTNSVAWDPVYKINFCPVMEKYVIDKTIAFADLPKVAVF